MSIKVGTNSSSVGYTEILLEYCVLVIHHSYFSILGQRPVITPQITQKNKKLHKSQIDLVFFLKSLFFSSGPLHLLIRRPQFAIYLSVSLNISSVYFLFSFTFFFFYFNLLYSPISSCFLLFESG